MKKNAEYIVLTQIISRSSTFRQTAEGRKIFLPRMGLATLKSGKTVNSKLLSVRWPEAVGQKFISKGSAKPVSKIPLEEN